MGTVTYIEDYLAKKRAEGDTLDLSFILQDDVFVFTEPVSFPLAEQDKNLVIDTSFLIRAEDEFIFPLEFSEDIFPPPGAARKD